MEFFAHTKPGDRKKSAWERLECHLGDVAGGENAQQGAADFAEPLGARRLGRVLGLWHDLGKYSLEFQRYLEGAGEADASCESLGGGRVDHSTAGARHAAMQFPGPVGRILAYCIAGHHAGLPNDGPADDRSSLTFRLSDDHKIPQILAVVPPENSIRGELGV